MLKKLVEFVSDRVSFLNYTKRDGKGKLPIEGRVVVALSDRTSIRFSWNLWSNFHHFTPIAVDPYEGRIQTSVGFAPFAVWLSIENHELARAIAPQKSTAYGMQSQPREVRIAAHDKCIWWSFWMNPDENSSTEPWYRRGSFDVASFLLGEAEYSKKVVEDPVRISIPMIEGTYAAQYTIENAMWKRPRWFAKRRTYAAITMDPRVDKSFRPIPIPGKGESGWDLDEDAIYSTTVEVPEKASPPKIVAHVVERVLERRQRYGGMNWRPEVRQTASAAPN